MLEKDSFNSSDLFFNLKKQLFGEEIYNNPAYNTSMNATPQTIGMENRNNSDDNANAATNLSTTGSELMNYQQPQTPIDFTDFLNLDDNQLSLNATESGALENDN